MNYYQLVVTAHYHVGVLERILRVVRHRGGHIQSMAMHENANTGLTLTLNLTNPNAKHQMLNQLSKLMDVIDVK